MKTEPKSKRVVKTIPYYSLMGAANAAGVTEGAVRSAIAGGHMVEYRSVDGKTPLVSGRDLERWMRTRRHAKETPSED